MAKEKTKAPSVRDLEPQSAVPSPGEPALLQRQENDLRRAILALGGVIDGDTVTFGEVTLDLAALQAHALDSEVEYLVLLHTELGRAAS